MPWQDIHARVEGRAARDIMINFVERSVNFLLSSYFLHMFEFWRQIMLQFH